MMNRLPMATLFATMTLLCACDGPATPETPTALSVSPQELLFSDEAPQHKVFMSTSPSGGRLDWSITAKPAWLEVTPTTGRINRETVEIQLAVPGIATLPAGTQQGWLELISDGGAARVNVTLQLGAKPVPSVSPGSLLIPETSDSATFMLRNSGRGNMSWTARSSTTVLRVSPSQGTVQHGDSVRVDVVADKAPLPAGQQDATVRIAAFGSADTVEVPVSIAVAATPLAVVSTSRLAFPAGIDSASFHLHNSGKGTLSWSAAGTQTWLSATPASGQIAPGDSALVTALINRAAVPEAEVTGSLTISSNSTSGAITLSATVTASQGVPHGVTVLDHRVVDAEYNAASSVIVTVSASPSRLNIIDLITGTTGSVALQLPPAAVAVRPDGAFAAVAHNGHISYVDLQTRAVTRMYAVSADIEDIVLADNGWVYAFPRVDQWETIRSIELATGTEHTNSGTIRAGTLVALHPSGDYIYGADNGLSPSDFEKYDIRSGPAQVMYDSPYHGHYAFSGNVWISEDGHRLFARSGNVFRSSTVRAEDMLYAGSLSGMSWVKSASDSDQLGRVVALPASSWGSTPASEIRVYDQAVLDFRGTVQLPGFPRPGGTVPSLGHFIFAARDGKDVYVLVQADPSGGLSQDWALVRMPASAFP